MRRRSKGESTRSESITVTYLPVFGSVLQIPVDCRRGVRAASFCSPGAQAIGSIAFLRTNLPPVFLRQVDDRQPKPKPALPLISHLRPNSPEIS